MKRYFAGKLILAGLVMIAAAGPAFGSPSADLKAFQHYFNNRFPKVKTGDFVNGPYAVNAAARAQWKQIMQFPPYTFAVSDGKQLFHQKFANGKSYADCFAHGGIGIRQNYPYFDTSKERVITLEAAINNCRKANGEKPYPYKKGKIAEIAAYMAYTSRGKKFDIKIPDDPKAKAAYEAGKKFFYERRGQLNFSCASCHVYESGQHLRSQVLAPALGILASFPIYRSKWGALGTIDRRFIGCNKKVRSKPFKPQSKIYRDLEYFLTYMSNGLPVAGPGARP